MIRVGVFIFSLMFSGFAMADASLLMAQCKGKNFDVNLGISRIGGKGHGSVSIPILLIEQNGQIVATKNVQLVSDGFEDEMLDGYVWTFVSSDNLAMLGLMVDNLTLLIPGTYTAYGSTDIEVDGKVFSDPQLSCTLTIQ